MQLHQCNILLLLSYTLITILGMCNRYNNKTNLKSRKGIKYLKKFAILQQKFFKNHQIHQNKSPPNFLMLHNYTQCTNQTRINWKHNTSQEKLYKYVDFNLNLQQ